MKPDPNYAQYLAQWNDAYQRLNYNQGLSSYFLGKSHDWAESSFAPTHHFARVLEVGAGTGAHIDSVRHTFDEYVMTDMNIDILQTAAKRSAATRNVRTEQQDATKLTYPDASFDRLIATHVLEHLPAPHQVLREWHRVVKPGGVITLVLPCDPGIAWRLGRAIGSRAKFVKVGMAYDYWMAREHINAINNLHALVQFYFDEVESFWRPFAIPSMDINLFYICHIKVGHNDKECNAKAIV